MMEPQADIETNGGHLEVATWRALVSAPHEHPALVAHLAAGCEQCEAFLATHVDALDGVTDQVLLSLSPRASAPLDELGWLKLRRKLGKRSAGRPFALAAMAAGLLIAVAVGVKSRSEPTAWNGLKGARGPALELAVARQTLDKGFARLDEGARVASETVLVFRATSTVEGPARIFLQRGGSTPSEVAVTELRTGPQALQTDQGLLGVALTGEHGPVTVWVVVAEGPFTTDAALSAINTLGTSEFGVGRVALLVE